MNFSAMGLAHLQPYQPAFHWRKPPEVVPQLTEKEKHRKEVEQRNREFARARSARLRAAMKAATRVNPESSVGRSTKPTKSETAPR